MGGYKVPRSEGGSCAQKAGMGSGLRTRVGTFFHFVQKICGPYAQERVVGRWEDQRRVGPENRSGEWT